MNRLAHFILLCLLLQASPGWALGEIGYVEDFSGNAKLYRVIRGDEQLPLKLCMPLYDGDLIEATDPRGQVALRLIGHPDRIIRRHADNKEKLRGTPQEAGFWSNLMDWAVASISPLDNDKRERVSTNIRADDTAVFGVPILADPQTLQAGKRTIAIGWVKPSQVVEISLTAKSGKKLVSKARGGGGIWVSPMLDLKPGAYRLSVSAGGNTETGNLKVVASKDLPEIPEELRRESVPEPLRRTAQALWLAAQDHGRFYLEALSMVANPQSAASERVLLEALIAGQKFDLPK